jgi:hypothetical protein
LPTPRPVFALEHRPQSLFRDFVGAALARAGERVLEVEPEVRAETRA